MLPRLITRKGEFTFVTPEERNALIAQYAAGYEEVVQALNGFPAESLGGPSDSRQVERA